MKYVSIDSFDKKISQIGLGTWQFGSKSWGYTIDFDKKTAIDIVHKALEMDVNVIDTAEAYGRGMSEKIVGEAIQGYDRENFLITTKFLPITVQPSKIVKALNNSLERLQTDYIDIYLIHWPNPILPLGRTLKHMEKMVDEGLIRYIGLSNFPKNRFVKAQQKSDHRILVNQVNYSLARSGIEKDLLPYATKESILIMAYSPLGQGWLTGKYSENKPTPKGIRRRNRLFRKQNFRRGEKLLSTIKEIALNHDVTMSQVAIAWVIRNPIVIAIPGAKSIDQLESNVRSSDVTLTKDDIKRLNEVSAEFKPKIVR